ncbi:ribosomal protein L7/L12 [Lysobacter sp. CA199]|uniref:ribosomal protein L7/L12 n=1 Tax=Lysobacter sp. CA199 TaxID=3455608 RepID=UPI003F8D1590
MTDNKAPFVPPQVATLLKSDRKIQAIKLVLDSNPGLDLRQARDAVEAYERQSTASGSTTAAASSAAGPAANAGFPEAARIAIQRGQTIVAIKIVREAYGLGLREAKDLVEAYIDRGDAALTGLAHAGPDRAADLPGEVVALILGGERTRAAQLLQSQHGLSAQESLARIADFEVGRKKRSRISDSGRTVGPGDRESGWLLALVAGVVVLALVLYFAGG